VAELPSLELVEGAAVVSVVGDGLSATSEPLARFLGALHRVGAAPLLAVATPLRLGAVVEEARAAAAQRELHRAFVAS